LAAGLCTSIEERGIVGTESTAGDWRYSLASVSVDEEVEVEVVAEAGSVRERFVRVAWGEPPVLLFLRPRERKANASRTGPCGWRGGLGILVEGGAASDGCID
jgi:hypothetical protein